ncbi:hypothetical protein AN1V17_28430 [Vallitalea sediminicola]
MKRKKGRVLTLLLVVFVMTLSSVTVNATTVTWPVVKKGDSGSNVTSLQYLLKSKGYNLSADGIFGSGTKSIVKNFQASNGLVSDGIVGEQTWLKLIVTLQYGTKSNAVKAVQYQLKDKYGFYYLDVDGDFGTMTKDVIETFQENEKITCDGIIGTETWLHLLGR